VHAPNRSCGAASESAADHAAIKYTIVCLARSCARHSLETAGHRWPALGRAHTTTRLAFAIAQIPFHIVTDSVSQHGHSLTGHARPVP
jgi:hypothetical protein